MICMNLTIPHDVFSEHQMNIFRRKNISFFNRCCCCCSSSSNRSDWLLFRNVKREKKSARARERERERRRRKEKAERNTLFDSFGRCFSLTDFLWRFLILEKLNRMQCRDNDFFLFSLLLREIFHRVNAHKSLCLALNKWIQCSNERCESVIESWRLLIMTKTSEDDDNDEEENNNIFWSLSKDISFLCFASTPIEWNI